MPAVSKSPTESRSAALAAKRGQAPKSRLKAASRDMFETMSEEELEHLAETPHRAFPTQARVLMKLACRRITHSFIRQERRIVASRQSVE